ncbi:MAG: nucleotidyl transferase AbiEii/AbiGii toxin family protein [Candidatus Marinimicrobia bacterium]|nr:nucleotidyl transferase AbiEii/AbiGii toxin family protein [Candidatus Neomarinimicrobiota bacterium]
MDQFRQHEIFEIEVLDCLNSARILPDLIFGGGTMLRLCHELNRYSIDLDFYLKSKDKKNGLPERILTGLNDKYEILDQAVKYRTILFELRSKKYPMRLKIEINTERECKQFEQNIAWSTFASKQILVNAIPIKDMLEMKIEAFLDRKEVRDAYDIEFLLRKGLTLPDNEKILTKISKILDFLTDQDIKVKLGSILEPDQRHYYRTKGFSFLKNKIETSF